MSLTCSAHPRSFGPDFGLNSTLVFLNNTNLKGIIRACDVQQDGFAWQHNDLVLTVYSAAVRRPTDSFF